MKSATAVRKIARLWHGRIKREDRERYAAYTMDHGITDYKATPGNAGAYLFLRDEGNVTHVVTLSFWHSIEDIKMFAGADDHRARYYPEDAGYLLEFEPTVKHFDVIE